MNTGHTDTAVTTIATIASNAGVTRRAQDAMTPIKKLIAPLVAAKKIADRLEEIDDHWKYLKPGYEPNPALRATLPGAAEVKTLLGYLSDALENPCDHRLARALIVVFLDCLGRNAGPNALSQISGLAHTVVEDATIDEDVDREITISAQCLAIALNRLLKRTKFVPTPSELFDACVEANGSLSKLHGRLMRCWEDSPGGSLVYELDYRAKRQAAIDAGKGWNDDKDGMWDDDDND